MAFVGIYDDVSILTQNRSNFRVHPRCRSPRLYPTSGLLSIHHNLQQYGTLETAAAVEFSSAKSSRGSPARSHWSSILVSWLHMAVGVVLGPLTRPNFILWIFGQNRRCPFAARRKAHVPNHETIRRHRVVTLETHLRHLCRALHQVRRNYFLNNLMLCRDYYRTASRTDVFRESELQHIQSRSRRWMST